MSNKLFDEVTATRRQIFQATATAVGGMSLAIVLPGCTTFRSNEIDESGSWKPNAWLEIQPDNTIVFTLDRVEMGQGIATGLSTLLAEELDVSPSKIEVEFAGANKAYRNPAYGVQVTGGSNSISTSWGPIREAGASVRLMILNAASEVLQVPVNYLSTDDGFIVHQGSNKRLSYGSLAGLASKESVPSKPELKNPDKYKYIGKQNNRIDAQKKSLGEAGFGIDVEIPNMKYAVVARSPIIGGKVGSHNGSAVALLPGVLDVIEISTGISIVADSYWRARKAQSALEVDWVKRSEAPLRSEEISAFYQQEASKEGGSVKRSEGNVKDAFEEAQKTLTVEFDAPFLAHATMEPMNCTASVKNGKADIWTSTQAPDVAQVVVAKVTDVSLSDVTVHNQFIGGGFGRRLNQDFVGEAAEISYKSGKVVKLIWSREEDMMHDSFRPASLHKISAALDDQGMPSGWDHNIIVPKIFDWAVWDVAPALFSWAPKFLYPMLGRVGQLTEGTPITPADTSPYEGADNLPYAIPSIQVTHTKADAGVPIAYWRSVGHSHNAFVVECFIDELAAEAKKDSYLYRRELLSNSPRLLNVLNLAASKGGWGEARSEGVYQGIAVHESFNTYVAEMVELEVHDNDIKILKVTCAVDCGLVINPDVVTMQMESGIIFGITAALYGEITIEDGKIQQDNFDTYPLLRIDQSPEIETIIVESTASPTGVGEPGLPPIAPAIANALFKATGRRFRSLPLKLS